MSGTKTWALGSIMGTKEGTGLEGRGGRPENPLGGVQREEELEITHLSHCPLPNAWGDAEHISQRKTKGWVTTRGNPAYWTMLSAKLQGQARAGASGRGLGMGGWGGKEESLSWELTAQRHRKGTQSSYFREERHVGESRNCKIKPRGSLG